MAGVALVLHSGGSSIRRLASDLFPAAASEGFAYSDLRPPAPFSGRLFSLLAAQPRGACVGLVVPVALAAAARPCSAGEVGSAVAGEAAVTAGPDGSPPLRAVLPIDDHLNLELCGPLTGRWPAGVPRDFPSLTGIYQPVVVRAAGGPRVYSSGVVVAGVADVRRLTVFESLAVREAGLSIVSDSLVPVTIVAAYHGLRLAACGVLQAPDRDRE